jgi:hypothetical protein
LLIYKGNKEEYIKVFIKKKRKKENPQKRILALESVSLALNIKKEKRIG